MAYRDGRVRQLSTLLPSGPLRSVAVTGMISLPNYHGTFSLRVTTKASRDLAGRCDKSLYLAGA